eukprot:364524-Chlamydomonas_euryale.AAC.9
MAAAENFMADVRLDGGDEVSADAPGVKDVGCGSDGLIGPLQGSRHPNALHMHYAGFISRWNVVGIVRGLSFDWCCGTCWYLRAAMKKSRMRSKGT